MVSIFVTEMHALLVLWWLLPLPTPFSFLLMLALLLLLLRDNISVTVPMLEVVDVLWWLLLAGADLVPVAEAGMRLSSMTCPMTDLQRLPALR